MMNKIHSCSACCAELPDQAVVCPSCGEAVPEDEWVTTVGDDVDPSACGKISSVSSRLENGLDPETKAWESVRRRADALMKDPMPDDVRKLDDPKEVTGKGLENDEFVFSYDSLVPFCTGRSNCLKVRIVPKVAVNGVRFEVCPSKGVCEERVKYALWDNPENEELGYKKDEFGQWLAVFSISDLPPGDVSCKLTLTYCVDGESREFIRTLKLVVDDRETAMEKARQNVVFHYNSQISVGGPVIVDGKAGKANLNFGGSSPETDRKVEDLLAHRDPMEVANDLSRSGAHKYVCVRLVSRFRREDELIWHGLPEDELQSVELRLKDGVRVVLYSGLEVRVGHPEIIDGQIVRPHKGIMIEPPTVGADDSEGTRRWIPAAAGDEKLAVYRRISRRHCEVALGDDGSPHVRDLGSANGTFLVRESVRNRLGADFAPVEGGELAFGSAIDAFALRVRSFGNETSAEETGPKCKKRMGVCLSRKDGPIHYVLLWSDFDLGTVSRAYRNFIVKWDERLGKFLLDHDGWEEWLLPGREITMSRFTPITVSKAWDK